MAIIKKFVVVQSLRHVQLFATPQTAALQASLSCTISWISLKLMSIEWVISNHLILCHPRLLPPSIFPIIRGFFPISWLFASGGQSIGASALTFTSSIYRRRQWHPTPVLLPGKSHGGRSLVGCSPWDLEESDTTERLDFHFSLACIGEGNGNPLQCSCLENPRDGGAWWAAVYGVA